MNNDINTSAKVMKWIAISLGTLLVLGSFSLNVWLVIRQSQTSHERQKITEQYTNLYAEYLEEVGSRPVSPTPTEVEKVIVAGPVGATGSSGRDGVDGKTPTAQELNTLIVLYCSTRNDCVGSRGIAGSNGSAGAAGPQGEPGVNGTNGLNGVDGRSVASVACENGTTLVFYDQYGAEIGRVGNFCF